MATEVIELDASGWSDVLDFYDATLKRLGAPPGHGKSIDALVDSMVWGGINRVEAPYVLRLRNAVRLPSDVTAEIALAKRAIEAARVEARDQTGRDVDVTIELA